MNRYRFSSNTYIYHDILSADFRGLFEVLMEREFTPYITFFSNSCPLPSLIQVNSDKMRHFISCCGRLVKISNVQDGDRVYIDTELFTLNQENRTIESSDHFKYNLTTRSGPPLDLDIVSVSQCTELSTGLNVVVILLALKERSSKTVKPSTNQWYTYRVLALKPAKRTYVTLQQFTLKYLLTSKDAMVADGPTVLWKDASKLYTWSRKRSESIVAKVNIKSIMWTGSCQNDLIVTGSTAHATSKMTEDMTSTDSNLFITTINLSNDEMEVRSVGTANVLPHEYTNICSVHVIHICYNSSIATYESELLAVTISGYILKFMNGNLKVAVPMNIEVNSSVKLLHWSSYAVDKEYVAVHHASNVFITDMKKREVVKVWPNVAHVVLDDFTGCGCPQLLLLHTNFDISSGWTLTDQDMWLMRRQREEDCHMADESEVRIGVPDKNQDTGNIQSVIDALTTKLKNELSLLNDRREEIERYRLQFLVDNWTRLTETSGKNSNHSNRSEAQLVNLVTNGHDTVNEWSARRSKSLAMKSAVEKSISLGPIWQRTVNNTWVIGISVQNNTNKFIEDIQVNATPVSSCGAASQNDEFHCQSYFYPTHSSTENTERHLLANISMTKKIKMDEQGDIAEDDNMNLGTQRNTLPDNHTQITKSENFSLLCVGTKLSPFMCGAALCVSDIPRFGALSSFTCQVFVHWREKSPDHDRRESSTVCEDNDGTAHVITGGTVSLHVADILQDKYSINLKPDSRISNHQDLSHDLLALFCIQHRTDLEVKSTCSGLHLFPVWLEKLAGFVYHDSYRSYVTSKTALDGVRIHVQMCVMNRAINLTVFTWDEHQLHLLIQHLYTCLPDDIIILSPSDLDTTLTECRRCMTEELKFTATAKEQSKGDNPLREMADLPERDDKNHVNLINIQENFKKRKRAVTDSSESLESASEKGAFMKELERLQESTDYSIARLQTHNLKSKIQM